MRSEGVGVAMSWSARRVVVGMFAGVGVAAAMSLAGPFGGAGANESVKDVLLNPTDLADPDTLIDLGVSTFKQAADRFLPKELPITVPGLDGLGPVTIPDATLTVIRPTDPFQGGGWIVRFEGGAELDLGGPPTSLALEIELEWEDEEDDHTPVVTFSAASAGALTVEEVLALGGLLQPEAAAAATIETTTAVSDVVLAFRWDGDGPSPRSWFDVTGKVTVGDRNLSLQFLLSGDRGAAKGDYVITALRFDSTVDGEDRVKLSELVNGNWGEIAGELDLPEFVVARVSGLEEGTTLGRMDLRVKSAQLAFFAGCAECTTALPEDLELDTNLTLIAKIDLAAFGPVVADAFGYPEGDSVVDLYGRLGVTFSSIGDDDPVQLDQVSLRARVPESGGVNALLPDWLEIGAWTLTLEYDADDLVGGITVGASTVVRIDLDGGEGADRFELVFDPTLATFTRTVDGTISVGVSAESNARWDGAFGLDWLDLTNLGLGFSFTEAANGQTAFDAAITSTFELAVPGRPDPTVGRLEARLGVTDDVRVSLRVAFGEDGSDVPIGAVLAVVADALGAAPDLSGDLGELVLDDLRFAIAVQSDGTVTFETFASAFVPMFGDVTGYLFVETGDPLRFFFGIRPTGARSLGELMSPPDGDGPPPHEVLSSIQLPMLGVIAAPVGGFEAASRDLTPDGFEFFGPLHGCSPPPATEPNGGTEGADATPPTECSPFEVKLDAGVNVAANIAFPGELAELAEQLWIDANSGVQFRGTLALPGLFDPGGDVEIKLGLRLTLPRLDPRDAVEFLEDGSLTLGVEAVLGTDPRIALFVEGELNTRWRRGDAPLPTGATCALGVPLPQFEDPLDGQENPTWCYDRLTFLVRSELSLSTAGFSVAFLGGLSAPDGWQHPFGLPGFEWLVINDLVLKLEVSFPAGTGGVAITAGFLGDIEIDNGDPARSNTVLRASLAAGATVQPISGPPGVTVIPNFKGVRAYVSRIGVSDVATLQKVMFPASAGVIDLAALPDIEFREVEFMFAIGSDADLCLEPRIGFAGELWIDPVGGATDDDDDGDGPCGPFGEHVDPEDCIAAREQGCFASVKATIGLDGIVASGALGNFELGPVTWSDALVDVQLKLGTAPVIAVSGGVAVEGLGTGGLAVRIEALPPKVEFFGYVTAFEAFEVQLGGSAVIGLDPLWPPTITSDLRFQAALRAQFDQFLRESVVTELDRIADRLDALDTALQLLVDDPVGNLPAARDALVAAGVTVPGWMSDLIDLVAEVRTILPSGSPMPTIEQLLSGEDLVFVFDALRSCRWYEFYDAGTDRCRLILNHSQTSTPTLWCVFPGELDATDKTCTYLVPLSDIVEALSLGVLPPNWNVALGQVHTAIVTTITSIDLVPTIAGLGVTDYLRDLSAQLADARFLSVECASFEWTAGQGAGEIDLKLLLHVLGEPYGFDVGIDLRSPSAGVRSVVAALLEMFLTGDPDSVVCTPEQPVPDWLSATGFGESATSLVIALDPLGPVDEGQQVTLTGSLTPAVPVDAPIALTVTWGDGTSSLVEGVTGSSFSASHVYVDDDPSGTPQDPYAIRVSTPGAFAAAEAVVIVRNVAPNGLVLTVDGDEMLDGTLALDEGSEFTLVGTFRDPGVRDTHTVTIAWGDGAATRLTSDDVVHQGGGVWKFSTTHTYVDDDPTGTPADPYVISVTVVDDDRGRLDATRTITVANVAPSAVTITPLIGGAGQPERIDEGVPVTYRISWTDPGARDTFLVVVDFGEPDDPTVVTRTTRHQTIDITHVYRDDDPTGTSVDEHVVTVVVTDDDTGVGTAEVAVDVHNVAPEVSVIGPADAGSYTDGDAFVRVQYSDPIGGRIVRDEHGAVTEISIEPFTVQAYDVTPDELTLRTALTRRDPAGGAPIEVTTFPTWLDLSSPTCEASGAYHRTCSWTLNAAVPGADPYVHTDLAPGTYDLVFIVSDDDDVNGDGEGSATLTIQVEPEDARVWYVGPTFAATTSARDGSATVELRSTVRDITSAVPSTDPDWDPWPGDIRTATMRFVEREASDRLLCAAAAIDEVFQPFSPFVAEHSIGVGSCPWEALLGGDDAAEYQIGTVVGGFYERDESDDDTVLTVARPLEDFITGGGFLELSSSAGVFAGADGSRSNFGFHVKFNRRLTNLQGGVTVIVRGADGSVYRVKSTAMDSLGVDREGNAQFESKANLTDVTDAAGPVSVGGNYVLQMTLSDRSDDGSADTIGFSLWDVRRTGGNGPNGTTTRLLLFSSHWDGNQTTEQHLGGGNLMVHYR